MEILKRVMYAPTANLYGSKSFNDEGKLKWNYPIRFEHEPYMEEIKDLVLNGEITDIVEITDKEIDALDKLWVPKNVDETKVTFIDEKTNERVLIGYVPSDIVFAKTIPITSLGVKYTCTEGSGRTVTFKVIVFDEYTERIDEMDDDENNFLGFGVLAMPIADFSNKFLCVGLTIKKGFDSLAISEFFTAGCTPAEDKMLQNAHRVIEVVDNSSIMLNIWYGIQIALLHPITKEYFSKGERIKRVDPVWEPKNKKRKSKYIRRKKIVLGEFEHLVFESTKSHQKGGKIVRRTVLWRVIGHWRTQNGHPVFVHGYWKGPARKSIEAIKNATANERELVINEKGGTNENKT